MDSVNARGKRVGEEKDGLAGGGGGIGPVGEKTVRVGGAKIKSGQFGVGQAGPTHGTVRIVGEQGGDQRLAGGSGALGGQLGTSEIGVVACHEAFNPSGLEKSHGRTGDDGDHEKGSDESKTSTGGFGC